MRIGIHANDRTLIVGRTGTGKTTLTLGLFEGLAAERRIVIDPKDDPAIRARYGPAVTAYEAPPEPPGVLRIVPPPGDAGAAVVERIFEGIFRAGHAAVWIDELPMIASAARVPRALEFCFQQGRSRGIGILACAQFPRRIPTMALDSANHLFSFHLARQRDRDAIADARGIDLDAAGQLERFRWIYVGDAGGPAFGAVEPKPAAQEPPGGVFENGRDPQVAQTGRRANAAALES